MAEFKGSDEFRPVSKMNCEMCVKDGTTLPASAFCETCMEYFCQTCARYHKIYLSTHELSQDENILTYACLEKCAVHKDNFIKFFCESCGVIGCNVCKTDVHKCEGNSVKLIAAQVKTIDTLEELSSLTKEIDVIAKKLSTAKKNIDKEEELATIATDELQKTKQAICSIFDDLESKMLSKINEKKIYGNTNLKLINDLESVLKSVLCEISKEKETVENHQKCKQFIIMKKVLKNLQDIKGKLQRLRESDESVKDYTFQPNPNLKQIQHVSSALQELGTLVEETESIDELKSATNSEKIQEMETRKTITYCKEIFVQAAKEKNECDISEICVLSEKYLIVCDVNNASVKLVDLNQNMVVFRRHVASAPISATRIDKNRVAITQTNKSNTNKGKIQFLVKTKQNELVFQKQYMITEMPCQCILHHDSTMYVAMKRDNEGKVQQIDMSGNVLANYEVDSYGEALFKNPDYLAYDTKRRILYVSDWGQDMIIELNEATGKRSPNEYTDLCNIKTYNFWRPAGIVCDQEGFVLICEYRTSSIRLMHPENKLKEYYLFQKEQDSVLKPFSGLAYSESNNKLYAARNDGNYISVFDVNEKQYIKQMKLQWTEEWVENDQSRKILLKSEANINSSLDNLHFLIPTSCLFSEHRSHCLKDSC